MSRLERLTVVTPPDIASTLSPVPPASIQLDMASASPFAAPGTTAIVLRYAPEFLIGFRSQT